MPQPGFERVASLSDVPPGEMLPVEAQGESILLANVEGQLFAVSETCTHEEGPLSEGYLEDHEVECPWHGATFDLQTGEVTGPPAMENLASYEVEVEGDDIYVGPQSK
ncbi:MAG: Rieske (2Fe-2S) protein [Chloroflexota bacterium]